MPINPLNHHYAMENPASVYDEEAMTALELAGRTTAKVNETVKAFNELEQETNDHLAQQDASIPVKVTAEVQRKIDSGEFDQSIDLYAGGLENRLDNLLGQVKNGSTTLDAEVIDARVDAQGTAHNNLGTAVRSIFANRTPPSYDANACMENGVYPVSSSQTWSNLPAGEDTGGIIVVFGKNTTTSAYQIFLSYDGTTMYTRNIMQGTFNEWKLITDINNLPGSFVCKSLPDGTDVDDLLDNGYYFTSSQYTYTNLPEALQWGGLVYNYCDPTEGRTANRHYQLAFDWWTGAIYTRNRVYDVFKPWNKLTTTADVEALIPALIEPSKEYYLQKVDGNKFYIYKKGVNGYIRYEYFHHTNSAINLDTWRMGEIYLCDKTMAPTKLISSSGADNEGVLKISGEADYVGGVHGDEKYTSVHIFVDGKHYTPNTLPNTNCDEVRIVVEANITHADTTSICFTKVKQTSFTQDGVRVVNRWTAKEAVTLAHVRGCLLSINKSCIGYYYDSHVNMVPMTVPASGGSISDDGMTDTFYMGDISAHVWLEKYGDAPSALYASYIQDFGERLKTYLDSYTNYNTTIGNEIVAINNFYITC